VSCLSVDGASCVRAQSDLKMLSLTLTGGCRKVHQSWCYSKYVVSFCLH